MVIQEIFGVNHHIKAVTDKFAADGYLALAPRFFDHIKPGIELGYTPDTIAEGRKYVTELGLDKPVQDVEAAIEELKRRGTKSETPKVPIQMHFGDKDMHIPMTHVNELRQLHPGVTIYDYPADHGFHCDERGSYDATASKLAYGRTLEFFAKHLA